MEKGRTDMHQGDFIGWFMSNAEREGFSEVRTACEMRGLHMLGTAILGKGRQNSFDSVYMKNPDSGIRIAAAMGSADGTHTFTAKSRGKKYRRAVKSSIRAFPGSHIVCSMDFFENKKAYCLMDFYESDRRDFYAVVSHFKDESGSKGRAVLMQEEDQSSYKCLFSDKGGITAVAVERGEGNTVVI
ncbi:MAG TPA: hypothetical protein ENN55_02745, partial [Firmicutes bacterium]|nr:hypothetical protein [Bacillota bacterium]